MLQAETVGKNLGYMKGIDSTIYPSVFFPPTIIALLSLSSTNYTDVCLPCWKGKKRWHQWQDRDQGHASGSKCSRPRMFRYIAGTCRGGGESRDLQGPEIGKGGFSQRMLVSRCFLKEQLGNRELQCMSGWEKQQRKVQFNARLQEIVLKKEEPNCERPQGHIKLGVCALACSHLNTTEDFERKRR